MKLLFFSCTPLRISAGMRESLYNCQTCNERIGKYGLWLALLSEPYWLPTASYSICPGARPMHSLCKKNAAQLVDWLKSWRGCMRFCDKLFEQGYDKLGRNSVRSLLGSTVLCLFTWRKDMYHRRQYTTISQHCMRIWIPGLFTSINTYLWACWLWFG